MTNNHRLLHIDVWRFFAIALVIVCHLIEFSHPFYKTALPGLVWRAHTLGRLGVELFFCISGYVICRGMMRETAARGALNMRGFYVRRAFRILPPLFLYGLVLAALAAAGLIAMEAAQFARSTVFVCNVGALGDCGWFLGHTWSLAYEEQFYLVFPLLFAMLAMARQRARLLALTLALAGVAVATCLLGLTGSAHYLAYFTYMTWGCLYALYQDELEPVLQRLPLPVWLGLAFALLARNLVAMPALFTDVLYPVLAPLAICAVIFGTPLRQPLVGALFSQRRLIYLGQISYTLYLWQQLATADHGFASPLWAPVLVGFVFVLAHLSFTYFESPLIRIGSTLSARWSHVQPKKPAAAPVYGIAGDMTGGAELHGGHQIQAH